MQRDDGAGTHVRTHPARSAFIDARLRHAAVLRGDRDRSPGEGSETRATEQLAAHAPGRCQPLPAGPGKQADGWCDDQPVAVEDDLRRYERGEGDERRDRPHRPATRSSAYE